MSKSEPRWTKGPWTDGRTVPVRGNAVQIAFLCATEPDSPQDIEARANMALIGAAPDLYEALRRLRGQAMLCVETNQGHAEIAAAVDAALSKANPYPEEVL